MTDLHKTFRICYPSLFVIFIPTAIVYYIMAKTNKNFSSHPQSLVKEKKITSLWVISVNLWRNEKISILSCKWIDWVVYIHFAFHYYLYPPPSMLNLLLYLCEDEIVIYLIQSNHHKDWTSGRRFISDKNIL